MVVIHNTIQFKTCPYCSEEILQDAIKCKHCGEFLTEEFRTKSNNIQPQVIHIENESTKSGGVAALLSFIIPGAGQMYNDNVGAGLAWFICVILGYVCFVVPGVILHLICILTAASGSKK